LREYRFNRAAFSKRGFATPRTGDRRSLNFSKTRIPFKLQRING
jgi:hypothetical protein